MADDRSASMLETMAIDAPHGHYDVAVLGGGLAGLTIAIQLKRERPDTRVLVTDKRTEPAPEAAFKVGESSVEIGAYYYREMIGMRDHLERYQQRKLGPAVLPAGRRQLATSPSASSSAPRATSTRSPIRSTAAVSRTSCSGAPARPAPTRSAAGGCRTSRSGRTDTRSSCPRRTRSASPPPAGSWTRAGARTSCAASSGLGEGVDTGPPLQRGVDPARRRDGLRGLDRRRGVARPDAREGPARSTPLRI